MVSLYFHIPFCTKKCPYCHFFVLPNQEALKKQFLHALYLEWKQRASFLEGKKIVSVYFGGGTPSLLGSPPIREILSWIAKDAVLAHDAEVTIEANPENTSFALMQELKGAGVNRLSLGVQSLDDAQLRFLGRGHTAKRALEAIQEAYMAGIDNISIDLMYEIPHQTQESWKATLRRLPSLPITHLSLYNLTFEKTALFFKQQKQLQPYLPSPEESLEMLLLAVSACASIGLNRYEISAFAREKVSRHNIGYWTARPFLGFGPSAFSYIEGKRQRNVEHLARYSSLLEKGSSPIDFEEQLQGEEKLKELLAVELRLLAGVDLDLFQKRHGVLSSKMWESLKKLEEKGWVKPEGKKIRLSEEGLLFYDSVACEII